MLYRIVFAQWTMLVHILSCLYCKSSVPQGLGVLWRKGAPWCSTSKSWLTVSPNMEKGCYSSLWGKCYIASSLNCGLLSPCLDEDSPLGCLWWSPTGGEVTHMCHTLSNGFSHWWQAPAHGGWLAKPWRLLGLHSSWWGWKLKLGEGYRAACYSGIPCIEDGSYGCGHSSQFSHWWEHGQQPMAHVGPSTWICSFIEYVL